MRSKTLESQFQSSQSSIIFLPQSFWTWPPCFWLTNWPNYRPKASVNRWVFKVVLKLSRVGAFWILAWTEFWSCCTESSVHKHWQTCCRGPQVRDGVCWWRRPWKDLYVRRRSLWQMRDLTRSQWSWVRVGGDVLPGQINFCYAVCVCDSCTLQNNSKGERNCVGQVTEN